MEARDEARMMSDLRPRQLKAIADLQDAYRRKYRAPILSAPTAFGKTHTAATIIRQALAKGKRVWFMAHLREIIKATAGKLDAEGIPYGYVMAGKPSRPELPVQIASVMTVARRAERAKYPPPDLLIIDECHLAIAASYKAVVAALGNPMLLGLSGSPERLDGRGLGELFDIIVPTCGTMDLIEEGLAPTVRYFCGERLDLSGIDKRAGEFAQDQSAAFMDRPALIGNAVDIWMERARGRPSIYFTAGIKHAQDMAEAFCKTGYKFVAVSGESDDDDRDRALIDLREGRIDGVCNAQLWIAGVDAPNVSCIGLTYLSMSLVKYLQTIGRGMRICDGKEDLVVMDHGNLLDIHGNPLMKREWSLEGKQARKKAEPDPDDIDIKQCPKCMRFVRAHIMLCPECGHIWQPKPREVRQVEGDLSEVDLSRRIARIEQGRAEDVEALMRLGHSSARAHIIVKARAEKKALQDAVVARGVKRSEVLRMKPKQLREMLRA